MRLKIKEIYSNGHTRVIRRFLLFPLILDYELRWLEFADISQVYKKEYPGRWVNSHWNNEEK
jgi:hypothetical protein